MALSVEKLSAIVFSSPDPARLAGFYREALGIGFQQESHGPMKDHWEVMLGDFHMAILRGGNAGKGIAPTFRVEGLDAWIEQLKQHPGATALHKPAELGEGKRLASFTDPDGNVFRLIDLGTHAG